VRRAFVLLLILAAGCANQRSQSQEFVAQGNQAATEGLPQLAVSDFKKAIEIDPSNATAYLDLGLVYRKQQQWADAESAIKKAIELAPKEPAFARALEALHAEQRKIDDEKKAADEKRAAEEKKAADAGGLLGQLGGGGVSSDSGLNTIGLPPTRPAPAFGGLENVGAREKSPSPPRVATGAVEVRGDLDKELIRRVIQRHVNEIRFCYEKELATKPTLEGRLVVQFTIGASGEVLASIVRDSTLNDAAVEQCVAHAVKRWVFPKPAGGIVIVSYPFVLNHA